jgi:uncharacterized membrane protein
MSDSASNNTSGMIDPGPSNAQLIYILYFVGFIVGVTTIIGVIFAYINRGRAGGYVESHYTWLIRTFWIGVLYSLIGVLLSVVFIGVFVLFAALVWAIVRLIKGLQALNRNEPVADPLTWLW